MNSLIGNVPDGWGQELLGELCDILPGPSGSRIRSREFKPGDVPVVAPRDLRDNRIVRGGSAVSPDVARSLGRYRLTVGDVVCARTGELGKQALAGPEQEGWLVGTSCLRLRSSERVSGVFLVYYLGHPAVRAWIFANSSGSVIQSLNRETLRSLPIVVPSVQEQEEMAGILGALDRKVAIHAEICAATSRLRDALLPLLLSGENVSS